MATLLAHRALLRLEGPDTLSFLDRIITCSVTDWEENTIRYGALLSPQGKIIADFLALRTDTGAWLDLHREALPLLEKRLGMLRLRSAVEIKPLTKYQVGLSEDGLSDPRSTDLPARIYAENINTEEGSQSIFIAAGVPEWGYDYRESEVFPADVNMDRMNGVDFKKGCFVGQEVVSRMHRRGKTRKRTLKLEGDRFDPGQDVTLDGRSIGTVTSTDGNHALALIRLDRLGAADNVLVGSNPANIVKPDWVQGEIEALLSDD